MAGVVPAVVIFLELLELSVGNHRLAYPEAVDANLVHGPLVFGAIFLTYRTAHEKTPARYPCEYQPCNRLFPGFGSLYGLFATRGRFFSRSGGRALRCAGRI